MATHCHTCGKGFNFFTCYRHPCVACGTNYCYDCLHGDNRILMLKPSDIIAPGSVNQVGNFSKPHRVCPNCYERLTQSGGSSQGMELDHAEPLATSHRSNKHSTNIEFDYTLGEKLGEGAFGIVVEAIDNSTSQSYALKIIDRTKLSAEDDSAVQHEVSILSNLHHPNIVRLLDFYTEPQKYYMVMEKVNGGELFDRIVAKRHYTEREARDLVRIVLSALKYCHDKNVVHRDIKPENLLMAHKTDDADVKLVDFGFAAVANGFNLTEPCGTPAYVAPEILEGRPYGKPVDMWSFGVLLYILLCGGPPFYAQDQQVLFKKILTGKFAFDLERWRNISSTAKDLISKLLTLSPIRRLTVDEALNHEWLQTHSTILANKQLNDGLVQLRKFQAAKKFKAGVRAVLAANRLNAGLINFIREQQQSQNLSISPSASQNPLANIPHTLEARYTLSKQLGEGGYAIVRLGINKLNKDEVAVKVFNVAKMSQQQIKYLHDEVNIMKQLVHPNIVRFYDFFEEKDTNYLVMEKISGGELFDRIVRKQRYSEREAQELAKTLLLTIKYLHDRNIVHR